MQITTNSFTLRGESGIVKIVSDSAFLPGDASIGYSSPAECDIAMESDGFRVSKVASLEMPSLRSFLMDLKDVLRTGTGMAGYSGCKGELSIKFIIDGGNNWIECSLNDKEIGKENFIQLKYPIEPSYLRDLERELEGLR